MGEVEIGMPGHSLELPQSGFCRHVELSRTDQSHVEGSVGKVLPVYEDPVRPSVPPKVLVLAFDLRIMLITYQHDFLALSQLWIDAVYYRLRLAVWGSIP